MNRNRRAVGLVIGMGIGAHRTQAHSMDDTLVGQDSLAPPDCGSLLLREP